MDDRDNRIGELEDQILTLASRINQFYKLIAYTTLTQFEGDSSMLSETREKLKKVISGEGVVKEWLIQKGKPIEPTLVDE